MDNLIDVLNLMDIDGVAEAAAENKNFEAVYSALYLKEPGSPAITSIERRVREYFAGLRLPPTPTIYDYLVLALRPKDLIATFNWDPFLCQAIRRNRSVTEMPHHSFLHGNVALGFSSRDQNAGPAGRYSMRTGLEFVPTRLLYPVTQKDYNKDEFICREWDRLKSWLKAAKRLTIFGYGAPHTDVEAVELMSRAWGDPEQRDLEQVEIIDTAPKDVVRERWNSFIHTHHYDHYANYFESVLARFPRRTGEWFMHQFNPRKEEEAFQEPNPVPVRFETLEEMWEWHKPLVNAERSAEAE